MKNLLNIKTPAENQAESLKSEFDLGHLGLTNTRKVYWNLPTEALYEEAVFRNEGKITHLGPLVVNTGAHTARSAQDKYIIRESTTEKHVWWGEYNRPYSVDKFSEFYSRVQGYLQGRDIFVQDCYVGADPEYRLPVRVISEHAWHSLFTRNMLILPRSAEKYKLFVPEFTLIAVPGFNALPQIDGTRTKTAIAISFAQNLGIIADSEYAGEIKKCLFTLMNYLMPLEGVMSMHCSANVGADGDAALFFGLSGTGKTTLFADPNRYLIGDDEHGWSDHGIFNFEGGCYAKVIQLSSDSEPEIYATTQRFGTILENVIFDPVTRHIDLDDDELTENTRASYPLSYIGNAVDSKMGGHPHNIIFLTCDAQGVLPPIARLNPEQAMYHFISGYTSKVGGTEVGLGEEPEITFSACFGAPFMVHHPIVYAELLKRKMIRYNANCWLVNTGWVGGPYGVGKRISIRYTRALLNAALEGKLDEVEYYTDPVFGFEVPKTCPDVPENVLYPSSAWPSQAKYDDRYHQLAARFINNFRKYADQCPPELVNAGPNVKRVQA
jgi:phosphoenolpyruvate carboxykinase (ATP)